MFSFNFNTNTRPYPRPTSKYYSIKLKVNIVSKYITIQEIRQAKTKTELIAEIGGLLGLLAGVSLITVLEFVEFFCKFCKTFFEFRTGQIARIVDA